MSNIYQPKGKEYRAYQETQEQRKQKPKSQKSVFNETNENIEWAKWTWNPVVGCNGGCPYCYARDIATRFYGHFKPTFFLERLEAPKNTKVPDRAKTEIGYRNVFVCSMSDLFGEWVPQEWIDRVMEVVRENPQWNFLFLTKNPSRYIGIEWPKNAWIGATIDTQKRVNEAIEAFKALRYELEGEGKKNILFISCEPLNEKIVLPVFEFGVHAGGLGAFDWLIVGSRSKSSQMPEFQPQWEWVESLLQQARQAGIQVYFKPNLTVRPKEYPE